jgi:hypothetical protein
MTCPLIAALVSNLAAARERLRLEKRAHGATDAEAQLDKAASELAGHMAECPLCRNWIQ